MGRNLQGKLTGAGDFRFVFCFVFLLEVVGEGLVVVEVCRGGFVYLRHCGQGECC